MTHLPSYDELPEVDGWKNAWGVWDKDGKKDIYGALNLLTPEVIQEAYKEARDGVHVSLNWPINSIATPGFGRKGLVHKPIDFYDTPMKSHAYDDEIEFNTQCSSQWDSLVHFHHQASAKGWNGVQTSVEELRNEDVGQDRSLPTLNHWHDRGGLVARGVLIDFKRYADETGRQFDPFTDAKITIEDIETIARRQNVTFRPGDVLLVRSGFTEGLTGQSADEQARLMGSHRACGVVGTAASARWFWDHHFAAVAGDMIAFEHLPPVDAHGEEKSLKDLVLHQYFLALFGMSIGELWDLKRLGEVCAQRGRWTFLLTSVPLNVPGLVGSPPNAIAIF